VVLSDVSSPQCQSPRRLRKGDRHLLLRAALNASPARSIASQSLTSS
jgi:hypothetical protein